MKALQLEIGIHVRNMKRFAFRPTYREFIIKIVALEMAIRELFASNRKAYEQLMLAELALEEIEPSPSAAKALEYIGAAKGLIATVALALVCYGVVCEDSEYKKGSARVRIARKEQTA